MIGSEAPVGLVQATSFDRSAIPDDKDITEFASKHQSFAGGVQMKDGSWYNILSIRHRNNTGDGVDYGMVLYAPLTSPTGNLVWRQQTGPDPGWANERTIADSQNPEIVASSSKPTNPNAKIWIEI